MSRFQIHDNLTAPDGSRAVVDGIVSVGGRLPNFIGVLAGSPAALRAYARCRAELRHGRLSVVTLERIALAIAEHHQTRQGIALHHRAASAAGLGLDEIALARRFDSADEREATLLRYLRALIQNPGSPPMYLHEEAREAGWSDEEILEAISYSALETLTAMINLAGDVPADGVPEQPITLCAA